MHVLEGAIPPESCLNATKEEKDAYNKYLDDSTDVQCLMLASMTPKLHKQYKEMDASSILHLCEMFATCTKSKKYEVSKALYKCKIVEEAQVGPHNQDD